MADPTWLVILGPDGSVLAVDGGAPGAWVGHKLAEREDAPAAVREAVPALLARVVDPRRQTSIERAEVRPAPDGTPAVTLIALEAIGVRRAPADLPEVLRSAVEALKRQAEALEIDVVVDCPSALTARVAVDPEKIAWAVATLVGSALRHVRRGTRHRPGGTVRVAVADEPARGEVTIAVSDDGPGIPEDKRPWLFTRRPGAPHAVGLGLLLVNDVVAAHGGWVEVASRTGVRDHGTTVTLHLPAR